MIRITSETDLLDSFREIDREEVELPQDFRFPFALKGYLAWSQPSGYRVFLVFENPEGGPPLGIVFRRDQSGGAAAGMCEWCHAVRAGDGVGLLTATASSRRRVGVSLCRDLSCKEKVESSPGVDDFPEAFSPRERVFRMTQRMLSFARQNLF